MELRKEAEAPNTRNWILPRLPVFLQDRRPIFLLIEVECKECGFIFRICRRCWRGQVYCSERCRVERKRRNHREAERRYRQTEKGKKAHREGENRRRYRFIKKDEKKMDDPSSTQLRLWCISVLIAFGRAISDCRAWFDRTGRCHFCGSLGEVVEAFPRRGYSRPLKE